ncbi:MAG: hypothetical protein JKY65_12635 [Planctomycetes bacterium]|nr:hypothetical protein [Planctomycetota bacterium]
MRGPAAKAIAGHHEGVDMGRRYRYVQKLKRKRAYQKRRTNRLNAAIAALKKVKDK